MKHGDITFSENSDFYKEGTWTTTCTGYSTNPTYTARYTKIGKLCYIHMTALTTGTSNNNGHTFTVPFNAKYDAKKVMGSAVEAGTTLATLAFGALTAGSNIVSIFKTPSQVDLANSGVVYPAEIDFVYEIE